jgi:hypothetical protein
MVRRGSVMVRRGSVMVRRGSARVRRGSFGSASACCKAGPSSILGLAPQGGVSPLSRQAMRKWREASANGDG